MYKNPIAIKVNCYNGFSFSQMLEGFNKAGFKYVELSASKGNNASLCADSTTQQLDEILNQLQDKNIKPLSLGGHMSLLDDNDADNFIKKLQIAGYLGCKYAVCSVDNSSHDGPLTDPAIIARATEKFLPYLKQYDLKLVIELHGKYSTGKIVSQICQASDPQWVKVNYDTGNALFWGGLEVEEMLSDLKQAKDYVGYMHLKDKLDEKHVWNFPAIGKGYMPFDEIFASINPSIPIIAEIEYTEKGIDDVKQADQAVMDSANFLKQKGFIL